MKKILITFIIVVVVSGLTALIFSGKTAGYWIHTGLNFSRVGQNVEALKAFDEALKLDPINPIIWHHKGSALQSIGRYEESIKALDESLKIGVNNDNYHYRTREIRLLKGEALNKLGRYEEAISVSDELLKRHPGYYYYNDTHALAIKGFALGKLNRYDEAIAAYTTIIGSSSQASESIYNRACIYSLKHQKSEALDDLKNAIGMSGSYKNKALNDIDFEWLRKDVEFSRITAKSSHEWYALGQQLLHQERYTAAVDAYNKALELSSKESYVWENKGYACLKLGRYDESIQSYESAIKLNPNSYNNWYNMACAYSLKMDKEHTLSNLRRAIALAPYIKRGVRKDKDFQWLWDDAEFRRITR